MSIDNWGMNHQRSQLVDFSYQQHTSQVHIFSGRQLDFTVGNVFEDVFDKLSRKLAFLAVTLMILTTWLILQQEGSGHSFWKTVLHVFGNSWNQPLYSSLWPKSVIGQAVIIFFSLYNMTICLMYTSVIISIMTSIKDPPGIDFMSDLNKTENKEIRIFMKKYSYVPGHLKSSKMLEGFENRIDYIVMPDTNRSAYLHDVLTAVRNGSHIFITNEGNWNDLMCPVNKDANRTLFKKGYFQKSKYVRNSNIAVLFFDQIYNINQN